MSTQRGEVWLADLDLAAGARPAVALSAPTDGTDGAFVTLVPHTTTPRHSHFEVAISASYLPAAGVFDAQGLVTVPRAKLVKVLGRLTGAQLSSVERAVSLWLGLHAASPDI